MGLFKEGTLQTVDGSALAVLDDEASDVEVERITAPANMDPKLREAYEWLEKAQSHLLRGNYRAAIEFAADAVNGIAITKDLHGYASY